MAKLRIGVDLDGVVYDFVDSFRRYLVGIGHALDALPEPNVWEMWEAWGMGKDEWLAHFSAGIESGEIFGSGAPYRGAAEVLDNLSLAGHAIHIVTHRNVHPDAIGLTAKWLDRHDIWHDTLTFSADKTVVPCDIFIEDNIDNARALDVAGTCAVLMDRAWNQNAPGIKRVSNWGEFQKMVDRVAGSVSA